MGVSMFVSIVGTIIVLILTIITISKGYGYKHKIDELPPEEQSEEIDNDTKHKVAQFPSEERQDEHKVN